LIGTDFTINRLIFLFVIKRTSQQS